MLAFYVVAAEDSGVPRDQLGGTIQADILKEYIAQKEWCFPVDPAMRLLGDMIEWCTREMPRWHPVSISGYHIREAGSTAAQELAFTLKDGFTYVEQAIARGLDVDDFAPRLSFFFNAQIDFFEEIAKYRAARRIWARELRDTYGAKNPNARWLMRFHTQTAGVSLTAQQPLNNIVRTAIEALAGVLGGTQSLHTNSLRRGARAPDRGRGAHRAAHAADHRARDRRDEHDRPARRLLLRRGADRRDGGARPTTTSRRIDELGGMVEAVKRNFPQREIADAAFELQREIDSGEPDRRRRQRATATATTSEIEILRIDPALERKQIGRAPGRPRAPRRRGGRARAGRAARGRGRSASAT